MSVRTSLTKLLMLQCVTRFYQSISRNFAKYIRHFVENCLPINGSVKTASLKLYNPKI